MIHERKFLNTLFSGNRKAPYQANDFYESDAEIVKLNGSMIAITTDYIVDEIDAGIYTNPYDVGWLSVISSASDITATGAKLKCVLSLIEIPSYLSENGAIELAKGVEEACVATKSYLLGGDTNWSQNLRAGSVAIGSFGDGSPVKRTGLNVNDSIFISNKMGVGNANAIVRLLLKNSYAKTILPRPVSHLSGLISKYASSAIDTSDGLFSGLATLGDLNGVGFDINIIFDNIIEGNSLNIAKNACIPPWYLLAGPVGEYELIFSIPNNKMQKFLAEAGNIGWAPIQIGIASQSKGLNYHTDTGTFFMDIENIVNTISRTYGKINEIIVELNKYSFE